MPTINRQHVNPRRRTTQSAARRNSSSGSSADWKASETFAKINIRGSKGATSSRDRKRLNRIGSFQTFFATHRRLVEGFLRLLTVTNKLLFFFSSYCIRRISALLCPTVFQHSKNWNFFFIAVYSTSKLLFFLHQKGGVCKSSVRPLLRSWEGEQQTRWMTCFLHVLCNNEWKKCNSPAHRPTMEEIQTSRENADRCEHELQLHNTPPLDCQKHFILYFKYFFYFYCKF